MKKKFILNFFISFLIIVSFFLLIYTHYKSHIVYDSNRLSHYIIYYLISSLGILFFSIIFFFNENLKENILVSFITIIFLLYSTELILNFIKYNNLDDIDIEKERRIKRAELIL